jgi:hypothetical protein
MGVWRFSALFRLRDKGARPRAPFDDVFKSVFCAVLLPIALTSLLIEPGAGRGSS